MLREKYSKTQISHRKCSNFLSLEEFECNSLLCAHHLVFKSPPPLPQQMSLKEDVTNAVFDIIVIVSVVLGQANRRYQRELCLPNQFLDANSLGNELHIVAIQ